MAHVGPPCLAPPRCGKCLSLRLGPEMAFIYRRGDRDHSHATGSGDVSSAAATIKPVIALFLLLVLALLIVANQHGGSLD